MIIDLTAVGAFVSLALGIINLLALLKTMLSAGEKKLDARLTAVETAASGIEKRVQTLEEELDHLPDKESQHRIELSMAQMNGRMDVLAERLEPLAAVTVRLQAFLLEQAKR